MNHFDDLLDRMSEGYRSNTDQSELRDEFLGDFEDFRRLLQEGRIRAAEKDENGNWEANPRVKEGILLAFGLGKNEAHDGGFMEFQDKDTLPPQEELGARTVPGGSSVRSGAHVSDDVIVMPPAYVNVGAYVDDDSMVDSHALVGSAAQVGEDVHLSTGAKLGGVLEPVNQSPVVVEDGAMIGANSGVYEGVIIGEDAVVAPNVELSASTEIYDAVNDEVYTGEIPEGAVVIPGTVEYDEIAGESVDKNIAIVAKYRDESTDANTALEDALR